jgi:hypothetical protein
MRRSLLIAALILLALPAAATAAAPEGSVWHEEYIESADPGRGCTPMSSGPREWPTTSRRRS